ncbi:hypothetical protein [Baaleninema sp.]|uniref:hypothetical protein n=1 Tax=Baaleninema sp. TaxID=3101197 RepID=UPI003D077BE2
MNQFTDFSDGNPNPSRQYSASEAVIQYFRDLSNAQSSETTLEAFETLWFPAPNSPEIPANRIVRDTLRQQNFEALQPPFWKSVYILLETWTAQRDIQAFQHFQQQLKDKLQRSSTVDFPSQSLPLFSRSPCYLQNWCNTLYHTQEYWDFNRIVEAYVSFETKTEPRNWSDRYLDTWLISIYLDCNQLVEKRQLAFEIANLIKYQFKIDLALYVARSQASSCALPHNPTIFGEEVLRVLKTIVASAMSVKHQRQARVFKFSSHNLNYKEYKKLLKAYALSSKGNSDFVRAFKSSLSEMLSHLYPSQDESFSSDVLRLTACDRTIGLLTTEDRRIPSPLFEMVVERGKFLTLVAILMKLVAISPASIAHLDRCIAALIEYYEEQPPLMVERVIPLFEILKIALAVCSGDVEYSLVKGREYVEIHRTEDLEGCQIFTRIKGQKV